MNADDGPLEVWLRQDDEEITCTVVRDDESDRGPVETVRRFKRARLPGPASGGDVALDALDALDVADDLLP
jgi:hypothetical protein